MYVCVYVCMYVCMYVCIGRGVSRIRVRLPFKRAPHTYGRELMRMTAGAQAYVPTAIRAPLALYPILSYPLLSSLLSPTTPRHSLPLSPPSHLPTYLPRASRLTPHLPPPSPFPPISPATLSQNSAMSTSLTLSPSGLCVVHSTVTSL